MKINLYGGPGIGKSTVASLIFAELKILGYNVERVDEYAKELVYEGIDLKTVDQSFQDRIFLEQLRREMLYKNKCEILVTDSPLILNCFYNKSNFSKDISKESLKEKQIHFFLIRKNENFQTLGRSHNEVESLLIDKKMMEFLKDSNVDFIKVEGDSKQKAKTIIKKIMEILDA